MKIARSLMLGVAAAGLMASGAQAADLLLPAAPEIIYDDVAFSFEGFYIGVQGGVFVPTETYGGFNHTAGLIGIVAGANFLVSDAILAGLEFQGDIFFGGVEGADTGHAADALILGRIGALVTDEVMVYAAAGVGIVGGEGFSATNDSGTFYAVGGGVEFAVTDNLGVRGEVLYKHLFNDQTESGSGVQATLGLLWHLN